MTGPVPVSSRRFPATTLPWVIAACAVAGFSLTLNPWLSFSSVAQVAQVSEWTWEPTLRAPLYFLVTLPLRLLPDTWVPAALNLMNALFAAATLGLLARTVAILPHNRTHEQRLRLGPQGNPLPFGTAWLPPVLAAGVCGLQLTFWEHATAGTPEMLNLLVFAYVVRCLMEFRLTGRHHWLWQSALLVGLGIANSYVFLGYFPIYLVCLVWLKRSTFFNSRFILTMALLGLAGCSLMALLPFIQSRTEDLGLGFLDLLRFCLTTHKSELFILPVSALGKLLLLLSLTSLIPALLIAIRWPQAFGDLSPQGIVVTTFLVHLVHIAFLVAGIWIAFDPPVSPRHLVPGRSCLTFYYVGAIAIGYFAGYLQVVFGRAPDQATYTFGRSQRSLLKDGIVAGVWVLAGVALAGLVVRNLPQIRTTNSSMVHDYATLIGDQVPEGNTIVLCDDTEREYVLRAALNQRGDRPDTILLNTHAMIWPKYHHVMAEQHPGRWPSLPPANLHTRLPDLSMVNLVKAFSRSNQVCYAHPSFGYYFETFHPQPAGILNVLHPYPTNTLIPPPLSDEAIELNEAFWDGPAQALLETVKNGVRLGQDSQRTQSPGSVLQKFFPQTEENRTAIILGQWLSRSLNSYGVDLQRSGRLEAAAVRFAQALQMNPDNIAASVNLAFNEDLQAGTPGLAKIPKSVEDQFADFRGTRQNVMQQVAIEFGLFDEPGFNMLMAELFTQGGLYRQALIEFNRVTELLPDELAPRLWYANLATTMRVPDEALKTVHEIQDQPDRFELNATNTTQLVFIEASALLAKQETDQAMEVIRTALTDAPDNTNLVNRAIKLLTRANLLTNALDVIDYQLLSRPNDVSLLVNKGFVLLRLTNHEPAVEILSQALQLQSNNAPARLNRAIANLRLERFEEARDDYSTLLLQFPNSHAIYYGLGEIAYQENDTNLAIHNYRLYLSNAPPNSAEARGVRERLEQLDRPTP